MASTFMEERQIPLTYFGDLTNQRASEAVQVSRATPFGERNSVSSSSNKLINNNLLVPKRKKAASQVTSPAKVNAKHNLKNNNTFTYNTQTKNSTTIKNSTRKIVIST